MQEQHRCMGLDLDDNDNCAFQVALSFANECVLDDDDKTDDAIQTRTSFMHHDTKLATVSGDSRPTNDIIASFIGDCSDHKMKSTVPVRSLQTQNSDALKQKISRRRLILNERKKLLRKAGIHENANWMSKESRNEIEYLQEKIEKLQLDLQVLLSRKNKPGSTQIKSHESIDSTRSVTPIPRVWEEIATRQMRRLKKTECENCHLKVAIQEQQKLARVMRDLVHKRDSHLVNDCSFFMDFHFTNRHVIRVLSSRRDGPGDFPLLLRHLETAYEEVDAVFASNGLDKMVLTSSDIHIREGVSGKYLEAYSNKVLPFGLRIAKEATWDHFKGSEKHLGNGNIYEKMAKHLDDPYTIIEEFTKEMHSRHARADIKAQQLVRRYMEPDRDIVIWVSIAEPVEIKHKMLPGLTYHLRGYAMTKRSLTSTPDEEVSQLQCVSLISLEPEAEANYGAETVRAVTKFLIVNAAQKMQAHQDRIEDALIDKQLRSRGVMMT
ncbi:hypothetical protein Plhal304r1_c009g0037741 [Plasmopara halstedii]